MARSKDNTAPETNQNADADEAHRLISVCAGDIALAISRMRRIHNAAIAYIDGVEEDPVEVKNSLESFFDCQKKYTDEIDSFLKGIFDGAHAIYLSNKSKGGV